MHQKKEANPNPGTQLINIEISHGHINKNDLIAPKSRKSIYKGTQMKETNTYEGYKHKNEGDKYTNINPQIPKSKPIDTNLVTYIHKPINTQIKIHFSKSPNPQITNNRERDFWPKVKKKQGKKENRNRDSGQTTFDGVEV